jgi:hypothetical protein
MAEDTFDIEILADGTIRIETDKISPANHRSAEDFLRFLEELTGAKVERRRKKGAHVHVHQHGKIEQK